MNINEIVATLEELIVRVTVLEGKLAKVSAANGDSEV